MVAEKSREKCEIGGKIVMKKIVAAAEGKKKCEAARRSKSSLNVVKISQVNMTNFSQKKKC